MMSSRLLHETAFQWEASFNAGANPVSKWVGIGTDQFSLRLSYSVFHTLVWGGLVASENVCVCVCVCVCATTTLVSVSNSL